MIWPPPAELDLRVSRDQAALVASALRHFARHYEPVSDPSRIAACIDLAKRVEREAGV